jgi:DEAD/DEAH box helicase domain-containing protein
MSHLKCSAFEIPFLEDEIFSPVATREILDYLTEQRVLHYSDGKYHWSSEVYPAEEISLRSASPDNVVIIDTTDNNKVIGETDLFSAHMLVHTEAIYMHGSRQYHVDQLDLDRKKAYVRQVLVDYFTDAITKTDIKVLVVDEEKVTDDTILRYGEIKVNTITTGYKKIKLFTHENIGSGRVHLPEIEMHTTSAWLELPEDLTLQMGISASELSGALQAVANLLRNVAPIFLMCDPTDIHAFPMIKSPFSQHPSVYVYDTYPGGIGLSFKLFNDPQPTLLAAIDLVEKCKCQSGCPSCVGPALEIGENAKQQALQILHKITRQLSKSD